MVWNNQQCPVGSAPLPEVHAYSKNKPKFNMDLLRTMIKKIPRRVRKTAEATRNSRIVFPTKVRTFPNTGVTNLCAKSVVITAKLQRNVVP